MSRKQALVSPSLTAASVAVKLAAAWSGFGATAPKVLGVKGIFPLQAPYAPRNEVQWLAYGLLANLFLIWIMRAVSEFYLYHSRLRD